MRLSSKTVMGSGGVMVGVVDGLRRASRMGSGWVEGCDSARKREKGQGK